MTITLICQAHGGYVRINIFIVLTRRADCVDVTKASGFPDVLGNTFSVCTF